MALPKKDTPLKSPLVEAFNNIVSINRSKSAMRSTQTSYNEFLRFMSVEVKNLEAIKLPDERKVKRLSNINIASTFGSAGSLLSSLASGALDAAGLVGSFFGGNKKNPRAGKPTPKGTKIRLPGVRGLPIISTALAGLDFAQGIAGGESVGKAGAGALGSAAGYAGGALAGSALAGVIGQALVPIPGLGFVLGAGVGALGGMAGGYLADRAYESVTGEGKAKEKTKARLKEQEQKQKIEASVSQTTFPQVLDKFDSVVSQFQRAVSSGLLGAISEDYEGTKGEEKDGEPMEPDTPELQNNNQQTGETGDYSVSGGSLPSSKRGSPYGPRGGRKHYGIDYPVNVGTPISVIQPGTVAFSGLDGGGNLSVYIDHADGSHTRYLHLSKTAVSQGQKIEPGTLIGYTGGAAGAYGSGNSTGPHLHYEYAPRGSGSVDPSQGNNDDKYFRFGGQVTVKPKVKSQTGVMGPSTGKYAVVATGTNTAGDPEKVKKDTLQIINDLRRKGYTPIIVPPNESAYSAAHKASVEAAKTGGAQVERGTYDSSDPLHLTMDSAKAIREKYKGAEFVGDSNAVRIAGGSNVQGRRVVGSQTSAAVQYARNLPDLPDVQQRMLAQSQIQSVSQQPVQPQQLQQYPSYNMSQNSVTIVPMMMGGGGGSQQRPMVISSGGGGGGTTIMPPVPQDQVLNSLFKTMLLTNLSGT